MQYGVDVSAYKRVRGSDRNKDIKIVVSPYRLAFHFFCALLICRVIVNFSVDGIDKFAPFGLAYITIFLNRDNRKEKILASIGVLLGYITLLPILSDGVMYIVSTAILVLMINVHIKLKERTNYIISFLSIFIVMIIYRMTVIQYTLWINLIISLIETVVIYPIFYILRYAVNCWDDLKTNHFFNTEEMISMALLVCLMVAGIGDITVLGIGIRNIVALFFVITTSFALGNSIGAAVGVAMGIIVGLASNDIMLYISVYSVCGLIVGIFRDTGKWVATAAYLIIYFILAIYSKNLGYEKAIETILSATIFLFIPNKFYKTIGTELDNEKKQEIITETHFNKIKDEFSRKLNDFTEVLSSISITMNGLVGNDRLLLKSKSSALIENLGDRVCSNCDLRFTCWKRELHSTYSAFGELIRNFQEEKNVFPEELEKKCVKKFALIKNTEEIVGNYIQEETLRRRLCEGRKLLAGHIGNMAITVGEIVDDFNRDITLCSDVERSIRKALNKTNFKYGSLLCYSDKKGRLNIKIIMDNCGGEQKCIKDLLPIINKALGKPMIVGGEGCSIDGRTNKCTVHIEEAPKYHISSHVALASKEGERFTGDSYSFGKTKDGKYMVVISDGMGSGAEAGEESKAAVELIEKFSQAGFSDITAINTVNSIMSMKFSEDEKFATLDMHNIDLYTGEVSFMKVGAVESFIKKGDKIEIIKSKTLPFGVLDTPDIDIVQKKVSNGDIIVTLSDGVLYGRNGEGGYQWLVDYLKETKSKNCKDIALEIMEKAKEISGGKAKDDMTIVVSKVYALY